MKVAMLRVGIDSAAGGMQGPLFRNGAFEFMPIPDGRSVDARTYGNTPGRHGHYLVEYFPLQRRAGMAGQSVHLDPEFVTFTYGDPTPPKRGLRRLDPGDIIIFYCGLEGRDFEFRPALYLAGFFEVEAAGLATDFSASDLAGLFGENFHVRHPSVFNKQKKDLVLVRGTPRSRLFSRAHRLSTYSTDKSGKPLKVISPEMQEVFGSFDGKLSFQRSPTRWVDEAYVERAASYIRSCE